MSTKRRNVSKLYHTRHEVAEILDISEDAVIDLINRGEVPAIRLPERIIRVPIAAFDRWREGYQPRRRAVSIAPARRRVQLGAGEPLPPPPD
jgi:hypothetical protein